MARGMHIAKRLLVEGADEKRVLPELIEAHGIPWGDRPSDWIVEIKEAGGVVPLLDPTWLSVHLDDPTLTHIGIVLDADRDAQAAYRRARDRCLAHFPGLPQSLSAGGVVIGDGKRTLGMWVMPDNQSPGMLETFLAYFVDASDPLWLHAQAARQHAETLGAPIKPTHRDKADIHTWLAWNDPPGRQLHDAIKQQILRPGAAGAEAFIDWFRQTFAL